MQQQDSTNEATCDYWLALADRMGEIRCRAMNAVEAALADLSGLTGDEKAALRKLEASLLRREQSLRQEAFRHPWASAVARTAQALEDFAACVEAA